MANSEGIRKRFKQLGCTVALIYTDKCCEERSFWEEAFGDVATRGKHKAGID